MINERPNIVATVSNRDGYSARALCLVDGFPAEVRLNVDTHHQEYSNYRIAVFNPVSMTWDEAYRLDYTDVGHMPIIGDDTVTLVELNTIADLLWRTASVVVVAANRRQDEIDVNLAVMRDQALDNARREARIAREWVAPEISQGDFVHQGELTLVDPVSEEQLAAMRAKLAGDS